MSVTVWLITIKAAHGSHTHQQTNELWWVCNGMFPSNTMGASTKMIHIQLVNKCHLKFWIIRKQYKTEGGATEQRQFVNIGTWKPHWLVKVIVSFTLAHYNPIFNSKMSMFICRSNLKSTMKSKQKTFKPNSRSHSSRMAQIWAGEVWGRYWGDWLF